MTTHVTHLVCILHTGSTARNPTRVEDLPSVEDIAAVAGSESKLDAIIIAKYEMAYMDDLSLEGDIPNDVSDN